jgi:copper homeostasis protein (lipoprotein)
MFRSRALLVGLLTLCCAACGTVSSNDRPANVIRTEMAVRYAGTLPCGDCGGIRTILTLYSNPDPSRYELRETYVGTRDGDLNFNTSGQWSIVHGIAGDVGAIVYRLTSEHPHQVRNYLKDSDHQLILLDRMRAVVSPKNPRLLVSVPAEAINPVVVTEQSADSIHLREGEWVIFRFSSNPSTGFRWTLANMPKTGLMLHGKSIYAKGASTRVLDTAGSEVWSLSALSVGQYRLEFVYRRPWEPLSARQQTMQFTLEVIP